MFKNPVAHRGYKHGLRLKYIDEITLEVTPGECHYTIDPDNIDDLIITLDHEYTIKIGYIRPWEYHFVYVNTADNKNITNIFYDITPPMFRLNSGGFYHESTNGRCIGAFLPGDGVLLPFEQISRLHHNYTNIPGDIYRLTRQIPKVSDQFKSWKADRIPSPIGDKLFIWKGNWSKYSFKAPFWGMSNDTCNLDQYVLFSIAITNQHPSSINCRKAQSTVDIQLNHINDPSVTFNIPGNGDSIIPDELWEFATEPFYTEIACPVNESGELELCSDNKVYNVLSEICSIGYALPLFITEYDGFFPEQYRGIYTGFDVAHDENYTITISPGQLHFRFPDGFGKLTDSIKYDCTAQLYDLSWHYLYITCPVDSCFITPDLISIVTIPPIKTHGGTYHPDLSSNLKCLAAIRTDNDGKIIDIRSHTEYYPPNECRFDCNDEVKLIIDNMHHLFPTRLNDILMPWAVSSNIDIPPYNISIVNPKQSRLIDYTQWYDDQIFDWTCYSAGNIHLEDSFIVYRASIDDDWVECVHIDNIHPDALMRFENTGSGLGLVVDEWDVCDGHLSDDGAYLISKPGERADILCNFTMGRPLARCYIDDHDDIMLSSFGVGAGQSHLLIKPDPMKEYIPSDLFDLSVIKRSGLKVGRVGRHLNHNNTMALDSIDYSSYPSIGIVLDVLKYESRSIPFQNVSSDDCLMLQYWFSEGTWDEIECDEDTLISTFTAHVYNRIDNLKESDFRLYDGHCHPLRVDKIESIPINHSVSILVDFCKDVYDTTSYLDTTSYCSPVDDLERSILHFMKIMPSETNFQLTDIAMPRNPLVQFSKVSDYINIDAFDRPGILAPPDYVSSLLYNLETLVNLHNSARHVILIGNRYSPCTSKYWADERSYVRPHPYLIHDYAHWSIANQLRFYAITEEYFEDLQFLSDCTGGLYQYGNFENLIGMLRQVHSHINAYTPPKQKIYFTPHNEVYGDDILTIKAVGPHYSTLNVAYNVHNKFDPCDLSRIL